MYRNLPAAQTKAAKKISSRQPRCIFEETCTDSRVALTYVSLYLTTGTLDRIPGCSVLHVREYI